MHTWRASDASRQHAVTTVVSTAAMSLKSVHMYRRVPADLSKSTHSGGLLSLVAVGVMTMLLVSNLKAFASVKVERSIEIDQVYDETWVVSFNITLPNLPCALTSRGALFSLMCV